MHKADWFFKGSTIIFEKHSSSINPMHFSKSISLCMISISFISLSSDSMQMDVFLPVPGSLAESTLSFLLMKSLGIPCMPVALLLLHLLALPCSKSRILVDGLLTCSSSIYDKILFLFKVLLLGTQPLIPNRMIISSYFTTILPSASMIMICMLWSFCCLVHATIKLAV